MITFEFLPNFSGRNCFFRTEKTVEKNAFFSALEETGEPWYICGVIKQNQSEVSQIQISFF